ncbi:zinc finger transcription factor [Colletotrichum nymphaeae SA-01]|uniref:Zinc finger transcription factor n=1 Tax=Colletotrichum nymphaeae SA-01 TaxID=1460502 RepID=A0A135U919_9PEZI|nr:zinc finger transcription factor [Colletotrichum nymphaeae SA-01]
MTTQTPKKDFSLAFNRKRRKVRKSCNACSSQKIRCGKQRPKCQRCETKSLECAYSMSMRTGERRRGLASPASLSDTQATTALVIKDGLALAMFNASTVSQISQQQQQQQERRMSEQPSKHHADLQDEMMWLPEGTSDSDNLLDQSFCFDTAADFDVLMTLNDLSPTSTKHSSTVMPTPMTQEHGRTSFFNQPMDCKMPQPMDAPLRHSGTVDSARSSSSTYSDEGLSCHSKTHDCTKEVLGIVSDFHVLAQGCLTAVKDPACTSHLGRLLDDNPREMGTVLSHNQEILRRLDKLLDCRCFMRQEVLVLVYLAVYEALGWYAAILGDEDSSQDVDQSKFSLFRRVAITSSFLGSYCLDNEAQRLVAAHLVLTHIREYVDPLIKRLRHWHPSAARHNSLPSTPSCPDAAICPISLPATKGHMSSVVDQHHQALEGELERITLKANSIKRT